MECPFSHASAAADLATRLADRGLEPVPIETPARGVALGVAARGPERLRRRSR